MSDFKQEWLMEIKRGWYLKMQDKTETEIRNKDMIDALSP